MWECMKNLSWIEFHGNEQLWCIRGFERQPEGVHYRTWKELDQSANKETYIRYNMCQIYNLTYKTSESCGIR